MSWPPFRNSLLDALGDEGLAILKPQMERITLDQGATLVAPFRQIEHVHFVENGLVSVVADHDLENCAEVALIGWEGMVGLPVALGCDDAPFRCVVQRKGWGYRIPSDCFRNACRESPTLNALMLRYAMAFGTQTTEGARVNGRYTVTIRVARWLLMVHDRVEGDVLHVTHDRISEALGVRRPGVTVATHLIEGDHLIKARRGVVSIVDRENLEAYAGGSYGLPEAEYDRLIVRPARGRRRNLDGHDGTSAALA